MEVFANGMFVTADGFNLDEVAVEVEEVGRFAGGYLVIAKRLLSIDGRRGDARVDGGE